MCPGNPIKHEGQGRGALCRLKGISAGTAGTFNARRNGAVHKAFLYAPRAYAPDGKVLPEHETFRHSMDEKRFAPDSDLSLGVVLLRVVSAVKTC